MNNRLRFLFLLIILFLPALVHAGDSKKWSVQGTVSEACQCTVFCQCEFNSKPTFGHCDDTEVLSIASGQYGDIKLDGLQVILVGASPEGERMVDTVGNLVFARIYVPEKVTDSEKDALAQLVRLMFGSFTNNRQRTSSNERVERAKIILSREGDHHKAQIPGVLDFDIQPVLGGDGKTPLILQNSLFTSYGLSDPIVAKSNVYKYSADGFHWDYTGRSASIRTVKMSGDLAGQNK